jgi:hypothetical protein
MAHRICRCCQQGDAALALVAYPRGLGVSGQQNAAPRQNLPRLASTETTQTGSPPLLRKLGELALQSCVWPHVHQHPASRNTALPTASGGLLRGRNSNGGRSKQPRPSPRGSHGGAGRRDRLALNTRNSDRRQRIPEATLRGCWVSRPSEPILCASLGPGRGLGEGQPLTAQKRSKVSRGTTR